MHRRVHHENDGEINPEHALVAAFLSVDEKEVVAGQIQ